MNLNSTLSPSSATYLPLVNNAAAGSVQNAQKKTENRPGTGSNFAWMVTGTVWSGVCQWALLVVLAKLGTVDMLGTFTLALAIAFPVLMFSCLNLRALYVTDIGGTYRFCEYLVLRLLMAVVSVAFTLAVAVAGHYNGQLVGAIFLISLAKALEYVSDILYGLLQRQERMAPISISMMLRGTLSLIALGLGIYARGSLVWGAGGMVLASAFTLLAFDVPVSLRLVNYRFADAWQECRACAGTILTGTGHSRLRTLAMAGVPLGLVVMLVSLNVNIPRYFVERSLGIRAQGIFSSLANLMAAGNMVVGALGQCATPRLARYYAAGDKRAFNSFLWVLVLASLGLGAAGFAVALTFGHPVLTLIYRPEYAARNDVFIWLMAASGVLYLGNTLGVALTAVRCLTPQLPLFAVSAGCTALACFVLVPVMGLTGAAAAILLSSLIQCVGGACLLRGVMRRAF